MAPTEVAGMCPVRLLVMIVRCLRKVAGGEVKKLGKMEAEMAMSSARRDPR